MENTYISHEPVPSKFVDQDNPRWEEWERICEYTGWNPVGRLQPVVYHGFIMPYNQNLGVNQNFYNELMERINNIKAIRMSFIGDAGSGKSYSAIHLARILERDKFSVDQIVFSGEDYIRLTNNLRAKKCIMIEEPTYIAAARGWQSKWQQAVVRTIESSRFDNNPLIVPVVNRNLLDKILREHYINYYAQMWDERGFGRVYRYKQNQWDSTGIRNTVTDLAIYQPGVDLATCGRKTCLGCPELEGCNKFIWAAYERKRAEWIAQYRAEDLETIEDAKSGKDSQSDKVRDIVDYAILNPENYMDDSGKWSVAMFVYHNNVNRVTGQMIKAICEKLAPTKKPKKERD